MLSRKGTLSRKRASMRRHGYGGDHRQMAPFSTARAGLGTSASTRRCSVPNLQPLNLPVSATLPCKSDTDITGSCSNYNNRQGSAGRGLGSNRMTATTRRPSAGNLCHTSYGAVAGIPESLSGMPGTVHPSGGVGDFLYPTSNGTARGNLPAFGSSSCSSLRSCGGLSTGSAVPSLAVCDSSSIGCFPPGGLLPDSKGGGLLAGGGQGGHARTQLSSLRGSVKVAGAVVGLGAGDGLLSGGDGVEPTPPPSEKALYESTVVWADGEDPDQTFSVLGGLCEAGVETSNPCDFIARAFSILGATWPVTVFLVVLLAMPLVMTTIGVNYLHECPVEPKLPIYLVVGGCFGIVKLLFLLWKQIKRHKEDLGDLHDDIDLLTMTRMTNIALNIFHCVWFAFGHYWVFHIWKPHFVAPLHEPRNWCDETVFMFSFWQLIICHVVLAILLALSAVMCCCFVCVKCVIADAKR